MVADFQYLYAFFCMNIREKEAEREVNLPKKEWQSPLPWPILKDGELLRRRCICSESD